MGSNEKSKYNKLFATAKEHPESYSAEVKGNIPSWLNGTLLKNSPGLLDIGPDSYHHWFDGLALIQRFNITNGKVEFSSKYLRSETYKRNMAAQRIVVSEFGTMGVPDPCKTLFNRYFSYFVPLEFTDNCVVNFIQCEDEVYATSETSVVHKIDPQTLDSTKRVSFKDYVAVNTSTAHPHYTKQGETLNMGSGNRNYCIIKVPKPNENSKQAGTCFSNMEIMGNLPMKSWRTPSYYHSFGMTERFIIFPEMPLKLSLFGLMTSPIRNRPFSEAIFWEKDELTNMQIFDMEKGKIHPIKYSAPTFFTFHHANSYEKDGCLIADMVAYLDGSFINAITLESFRNNKMVMNNLGDKDSDGCLWRFVIPLTVPQGAKSGDNILAGKEISGKCQAILKKDGSIYLKPHVLTEESFEFPRYNYEYNGKEYRYLYGTAAKKDTNDALLGQGVYKFDLVNGSVNTWNRENEFQYACEPVFVPKPAAKSEDDGVILVAVCNAAEEDKPFLLVLDAETMTELGRAVINSDLPPGFHNHFVPKK